MGTMTRIVLIEHDPDFADCLRSILEAEGFEVELAQSVNDAASKVADLRPHVTVVDLHDGTSVGTEDIRRLSDANGDLPILVTANYKSPEIACKALGVGAKDYLLKPYSTREILDRIHFLAGSTPENTNGKGIDEIAGNIGRITSIDDVLKITLDQLASSLHLADSLIAYNGVDGFNIMASRGYVPDPITKLIKFSDEHLETLVKSCDDPLILPSDLVPTIVEKLGIKGHRPFPTIMPLVHRPTAKTTTELIGFVMGHGGFVLEENDLLEMELFLSQIALELTPFLTEGYISDQTQIYEREGEIILPDTPREEATDLIVDYSKPYLSHGTDQFWVRLVLDEAVSNAIIHGHEEPLDEPVTTVIIRYSLGPGQIMLTVTDSGEGFDYDNIPDPTADENLLSINGRGIFLMRNVMDQVVFNEKGNQVSLVKRLDGTPLGPRKAVMNKFEFW